MKVTINGCELNVEVMGPEDGPVLIAHHGGGGIGSLAEPKSTFGPLSDRFRVVVFDARGCGHSEGIPPYSHAQWAADVDGLRQWIGADKIVVAGGSYGGFIALEYAVAYPEHVQAIVLRDTSADAGNLDTAYENARNQDRVEINWDNFDRYWTGRIPTTRTSRRAGRRSSRSTTTSTTRSPRPRGSRPASTGTRPTTGASSTTSRTTTSSRSCPRSRRPRSSPSAGCDWVTPVSSAQTIASLMPNAKLVVFEKSGHSPQIEERELFLSTVRDFLDTAVPAAKIG